MVSRIEVGFKKGIRDALGEKIKKRIFDNFSLPVEAVQTLHVYTLEGALKKQELLMAAQGPFSDPVIQHFAVNRPWPGILTGLSKWASGRALRIMWAKPPARRWNFFFK